MRTLGIVAVLMLSGCTAVQNVKYAAEHSPQYQAGTASYKAGFENGCHSRVSEVREWLPMKGDAFIRDDARMKTDHDYALGWNDGVRRCGGDGSAAPIIVMPK